MLLKKRWMKLWPGIEVECCKADMKVELVNDGP